MKKFVLIFILTLCVSAFARESPRIAVYVTGGASGDERKAFGAQMLSALAGGGRYGGIVRQSAFVAELDSVRESLGGMVDDTLVTETGKRFDAAFVCIADLTAAFGAFQISARIIDAETNDVAYIGVASGELSTMRDLERLSDKVVSAMFGEQVPSKEVPEPDPKDAAMKLGTNQEIDKGETVVKDTASPVAVSDTGQPKTEMGFVEYKVPILGDIPVIGKLFRRKRYEPVVGGVDPDKIKGEITFEVQSNVVKFYRKGGTFEPTQLKILDMTGNTVMDVDITDKRRSADDDGLREIGVWDMRNLRGQKVRRGTYYVRGAVRTIDGKREKFSLTIVIGDM